MLPSVRRALLAVFNRHGFPTEAPTPHSPLSKIVTPSKMVFLSRLVDHVVKEGEKVLVFSQKTGALDEAETMLGAKVG